MLCTPAVYGERALTVVPRRGGATLAAGARGLPRRRAAVRAATAAVAAASEQRHV